MRRSERVDSFIERRLGDSAIMERRPSSFGRDGRGSGMEASFCLDSATQVERSLAESGDFLELGIGFIRRIRRSKLRDGQQKN